MICQNCQTQVDNDLIFCTNCGERISAATTEAATGLTKPENAPKPASNIKWMTLIVALIAVPASIFGVYLLLSKNDSPIVQNTAKTNSAAKTPTRKTNANKTENPDSFHKNVNADNTNTSQSNANPDTPVKEVEIINERIEIHANSSYAKSFAVKTETAKIVGDVEVLQGENITGYVYLQTVYDEHFPDPNYKMFSFGEAKKSIVNQTLIKENYVLVFANDSDKSVIIKSKISVK